MNNLQFGHPFKKNTHTQNPDFLNCIKDFLNRIKDFLHGTNDFPNRTNDFLNRKNNFLNRTNDFLNRTNDFLFYPAGQIGTNTPLYIRILGAKRIMLDNLRLHVVKPVWIPNTSQFSIIIIHEFGLFRNLTDSTSVFGIH
jgi:hypothetical protein